MQTDVVLLPGLHGSTTLLETFIALAPPWARCRAIALPLDGEQTFDALATAIEPALRTLEHFVLIGESFGGPVAAVLTERLREKVDLLVLCNPLVEAPIVFPTSFAASVLHSRLMRTWMVSVALAGGDRRLASAALHEVRALPREVLVRRLEVTFDARREALAKHLSAPLLAITSRSDRLLSARPIRNLVRGIPGAVHSELPGPHLVLEVFPTEVWVAIRAELERAA